MVEYGPVAECLRPPDATLRRCGAFSFPPHDRIA
jgi:hypothetical protein